MVNHGKVKTGVVSPNFFWDAGGWMNVLWTDFEYLLVAFICQGNSNSDEKVT